MLNKILIATICFILVGAVFAGATSALEQSVDTRAGLSNVRAYAAPMTDDGISFAIDGGELFAGSPTEWTQVKVPTGIIVNAVAVDAVDQNLVYIGAANELAIYRSADRGATWLRIPLSRDYVGGVTDIAVDSSQRLVYVATDTAGLFRLRDVGSSMVVSGHLLINEPVLGVVADSGGSGLALARTAWRLYRAEDFGLRWIEVTDLGSAPTALEIAGTNPATVYVGTTDRGLIKSHNGVDWTSANEGLGMVPGSRLRIDALAIDTLQPDVLYVATSYIFGSTTLHESHVGVAMSVDGAANWAPLNAMTDVAVAELLPTAGKTGNVYALTTTSRTPVALGAAIPTGEAMNVAAQENYPAGLDNRSAGAWVVAGLAALSLFFALLIDIKRHRRDAYGSTLAPNYANSRR